MLEAARARRADGAAVVVGYADPHRSPDVQSLLHEFEALPSAARALDMDAALARRPGLLLLDNLAHRNPTGARHAERWQDVQELLAEGISIYATLNVYQLESLKDLVAEITGVRIEVTIPDSVFEHADEVELVDALPEAILHHLEVGQAVFPERPPEDREQFFRRGNLIALRELALRRLSDRVDAQLRRYRREHAIPRAWPVTDRLMGCVSASPQSARVVRATKRFADALRAPWVVVSVETPGSARFSDEDRVRLTQTLQLAEQLGAEPVSLSGERVADEILAYARRQNISKIVAGKPLRSIWRRRLSGSIVDALVEGSGDIDVYITTGEEAPHLPFVAAPRPRAQDWPAYIRAGLAVALCTGVSALMLPHFNPANLIMVYLLGVVGVASRYGRGPSILASLLSVAAFDFFFVHPYFSFAVSDTQYLVTFAVMLAVALLISQLTARIRWQAEAARSREVQTSALYAMSRELAGVRGVGDVLRVGARHIGQIFQGRVVVLLPDAAGGLAPQAAATEFEPGQAEMEVGRWASLRQEKAGLGTTSFPEAKSLYLPLQASTATLGVIGFRPANPRALGSTDQLRQLETFVTQVALALERAQLAEEAQQAQVRAEAEQLRNALLSSVSHDLRTPLAAITGAASSLLETEASFDAPTRREMLETIHEESERLNRLVQNLLQMTRVEAGALQLRRDWYPLEEVIGSALGRLARQLDGRPIVTRLPDDLPLVPIDDVLIEQVLINLLDNAARYTPPGTPVEVSASAGDGHVLMEVADRGPGLAAGEAEKIFEKFYRGQSASGRGAGLGLAICRGLVQAHGGRMWVDAREVGGLAFRFTLPLIGTPPRLEDSDA